MSQKDAPNGSRNDLRGVGGWLGVFVLAMTAGLAFAYQLDPAPKNMADRIWSGYSAFGSVIIAIVGGLIAAKATLAGVAAQAEIAEQAERVKRRIAEHDRRIDALNRTTSGIVSYENSGKLLTIERKIYEIVRKPKVGDPNMERVQQAFETVLAKSRDVVLGAERILEAADAYGRVSGEADRPYLSDTVAIWSSGAYHSAIEAAKDNEFEPIREFMDETAILKRYIRALRNHEEELKAATGEGREAKPLNDFDSDVGVAEMREWREKIGGMKTEAGASQRESSK